VALVGLGLEATVTHLGRSVDELQLDVFQSKPLGVNQQRLSECQNSLLGSDATSLDHDEILLDHAVMGETTHWVDALVSGVVLGGSIVLDQLSILGVVSVLDGVDLLVDLRTVMVTLLTSTSNSVLDTRRMPSTDTGNLAQTLVRLARQLLGVPSGGDTFKAFALGDSDEINHLVLGKNILDGHGLFEKISGKVNLVGYGSTIDLNLHDMGLFLTLAQKLLLSVHDHSHDLAVFLNLGQVLFDFFFSGLILPLHTGLGECLLLGLRPILIEATLAFFAQVLSPDRLQRPQATGSADISDNSNADHGGRFDNSNSLNDILFVDLRTWTMWVMPALNPRKAVMWHGLDESSLGKALTLPR